MYNIYTFLLSSEAEQRAVNSKVPGSIPGGGAIDIINLFGMTNAVKRNSPLSRQGEQSGV